MIRFNDKKKNKLFDYFDSLFIFMMNASYILDFFLFINITTLLTQLLQIYKFN